MNDNYAIMANSIRFLSVSAIQKAASGHPGMPLGMADVATILFHKFLKFSVKNYNWFNRDRFILSNGHGSMLLYSILYFMGYLSINDIKQFRQINSLTPGHPEYGCTPGIEVTTGPLGQGFASAVGFAIAERILSQRFGSDLVDHYTYVMVGDGCLMEGVSHESASLAGHLQLNKLIVLFDDNGISIDGSTSLSMSDDVKARFLSYGWDVQEIDGHNFDSIIQAIMNAKLADKPSMICCRTIIGKSMLSKENTCFAHSWPFDENDIQIMRKQLNWSHDAFNIPHEIMLLWQQAVKRTEREYDEWVDKFQKYSKHSCDFSEIIADGVPESVFLELNKFKAHLHKLCVNEATRKSSGRVLEILTKMSTKFVGGSSDLTNSNYTKTSNMKVITKNFFDASYIHYGIREHAMAGCMNGMALHGGIIPYGGTFLIFSDYCKPSIRLSALMKQQVIYIMTHDSIGVGEDGPTHQPVEHLTSLRAIPNLYVFRPADAAEVLECWEIALKLTKSPSLFALSRQNVSYLRKVESNTNLCSKGAYIICDYENKLDVTIFATGSEVEIALKAKTILCNKGLGVRVISFPCWEIFDQQDKNYISELLDNDSVKVAVEAASACGWHKYIGSNGIFVGMESFGASGHYKDLYDYFGITPDNIANKVLHTLAERNAEYD
ncbi:transketolase [Candidatus Neoehrlichia procyonis]|nr:transketolase [Candidatus Neoehrlichia lotoris]